MKCNLKVTVVLQVNTLVMTGSAALLTIHEVDQVHVTLSECGRGTDLGSSIGLLFDSTFTGLITVA